MDAGPPSSTRSKVMPLSPSPSPDTVKGRAESIFTRGMRKMVMAGTFILVYLGPGSVAAAHILDRDAASPGSPDAGIGSLGV